MEVPRYREIAVILDMYATEVQALAHWNDQDSDHAANSSLNPHDVSLETIKRRAGRMMDSRATADALGISAGRLARLKSCGVLVPIVRGHGGLLSKYDRVAVEGIITLAKPVSRQTYTGSGLTIDEFRFKANCSFAQVVSDIIAGRLNVVDSSPLGRGLGAVLISPESLPPRRKAAYHFVPRKKRSDLISVTLIQAATSLGTTRDMVKKLIDAGVLKHAQEGGTAAIDRESVSHFRLHYAPAHMYSAALGCKRREAAKLLKARGVGVPRELVGCVTLFVRRVDAERALGLAQGTFQDRPEAQELHNDLEIYLERFAQGYTLRWHPDSTTMVLSDSTRRLNLLIEPGERRLRIVVPLNSARVRAHQSAINHGWPQAVPQVLPLHGLSVTESHPYDGNDPAKAFNWLLQRAAVLREIQVPHHPLARPGSRSR
ncbi:hypothetical protein [Mesorhizobium sp. 10J20-29]